MKPEALRPRFRSHLVWLTALGIASAVFSATVGLSQSHSAEPRSSASVRRSSGSVGPGHLTVLLHHGQVVRMPSPFSEVLVGSSEIADVLPLTDRTVYLLGKKVGTTSLSVFDASKQLIGVLEVEVRRDIRGLERAIHQFTR